MYVIFFKRFSIDIQHEAMIPLIDSIHPRLQADSVGNTVVGFINQIVIHWLIA